MSSPSEEEEEEEARETVIEKPNGDLHVTDVLGRTATLHWSRFHGLIVSSDHVAVYLGQPETLAWLASRVSTPPAGEERLVQALRRLLNKHSLHGDVPADDLDDLLDRFDDGAPMSTPPSEDWEYGTGYEAHNGVEMRWFSLGGGAFTIREAAENDLERYRDDSQVRLIRRRKPGPWEPVPAVPVPPTEPAEPDPYAECRCGHGRHTHVRYTGACGLCDCAAVRPAPTEPGER